MKSAKIMIIAGTLLASTIAFSGVPPTKQPHPATTLRTAEEFAQLKPGDKVAYICKQCDSVHVQTVETREQAMALCKEGETVSCPSCQKKYKTTLRGPRSKAGSLPMVTYVNDKGEECMFVARLSPEVK